MVHDVVTLSCCVAAKATRGSCLQAGYPKMERESSAPSHENPTTPPSTLRSSSSLTLAAATAGTNNPNPLNPAILNSFQQCPLHDPALFSLDVGFLIALPSFSCFELDNNTRTSSSSTPATSSSSRKQTAFSFRLSCLAIVFAFAPLFNWQEDIAVEWQQDLK
ncbi:unnamed protein product [Amoebophrya sp. A25]|nr:unnamed protein product [Amoebophrya sp. A25]|eukprot:GSA25T00006049001.1